VRNALSAILLMLNSRYHQISDAALDFTTLLQPQKPVTRAESAASTWYFGTKTDGISARKSSRLGEINI
jgi:hypothetical protein